MKSTIYLSILFFLLISSPLLISQTVPTIPITYGIDVEDWWQTHPYNPEGSNYLPDISSPSNSIQLSNGDEIQAVIDTITVPTTIYLEAGNYDGFDIIGKSNIHIIGLDNQVFIVTKSCQLAPTLLANDYNAFVPCIANFNPDCIIPFNNPPQNIYFKNLIFDGGNVLEIGIWINRIKDMMIEDCIFQNYIDPASNHLGLIAGRMGSRNVWVRNCEFYGNQRYALYLDGCHGCGVMDSYIDEHFGSGGILYLTNDDLSRDYNNNGVQDPNELMTANYDIVYNNTFEGWIPVAVSIMGANSLVLQNKVLHEVNTFSVLNSKTSHIWSGLEYEYYGNKVLENKIEDRVILEFVRVDKFPYTTLPLGNDFKVGQNEIRCNVVEGTGNLISETGDPLDEPNVVEGNCINDSDCVPCSLTSIQKNKLSNQIYLFPNPATNQIQLEFSMPISGEEIILTDLNGRHILKQKINSNKVKIQVDEIPKGFYILFLKTATTILSKKITIQ